MTYLNEYTSVNVTHWTTNEEDFIPRFSAGASFGAYIAKHKRINELAEGLNSTDHNLIYLDDYNEAKEYKIKFLASSDFIIGSEEDNVSIAGNGIYLSELNKIHLNFQQGKTYFIVIQAEMITILSEK